MYFFLFSYFGEDDKNSQITLGEGCHSPQGVPKQGITFTVYIYLTSILEPSLNNEGLGTGIRVGCVLGD